MLTIAAMGSGQNRYYTSLATTAYYTEGGEPPGQWAGGAAKPLGLSGQVKPEQLQALFDGFDPHTGRPLVQNAGQMQGRYGRKPGWDFTFHVPKSVSLLWAMSDRDTQKAIQEGARSAIKSTIELLEQEAGRSAKGKGGCEHVPAQLLVAVFPHASSRAMDCDYHLHCLIQNVGVCEDGRTRSLLSRPLYQWSSVACRHFRVALEADLRERLGLDVERPVNEKGVKGPLWEIRGAPEGLAGLFSKRRQEIEKHLGEKKLDSPAAATVAAIATRSAKKAVPPRKELFQRWRKEAQDAGYSLDWVNKVIGHRHTVDQFAEYRKARSTAVDRITSSRSHFSRRELLQRVLEESMGRGLRPEFIREQVDGDLSRGAQFVNLGTRNGQQRFTTPAVLDMEKRLLESVDRLHEAKYKPVSDRIVDQAIQRAKIDGKSVKLTGEQQKAVRHLTQSPGRVKLVTGLAGTGKTTMLRITRESFEEAGYELHGCALAGVAAKKLQTESGISSDTLAMTLKQLNPKGTDVFKHHVRQLSRAARKRSTWKYPKLKLHSKSVIVLDESSMVGTRDFMHLLQAVEKANAQIVCLGDHRQLPAIEAGGAFGSILKRLGGIDLQEIRRQEKPVDRQRVKKLSRGEAEEVVKGIASEGNLHVASDRTKAEEKLVRDWSHQGGAHSPRDHLMFAGTNQEVDRLNALAQQRRLNEGEIQARRGIKIGEATIYQGDRIIITKKNRKLGLENGDQGEVIAIRKGALLERVAIRLDGEEQTRVIPVRTMLATEFDHVRLGYAHTVHRMQGASVEHGYCLLGGRMTDREMTYVQASRHRKTLSLYADENECGIALTNLAREATGEGPQLRDPPGISTDRSPLVEQMSKSRAQDLAHDVLSLPRSGGGLTGELTLEIER